MPGNTRALSPLLPVALFMVVGCTGLLTPALDRGARQQDPFPSSLQPPSGRGGEPYPLTVGNRWGYSFRGTLTSIPYPGEPPIEPGTIQSVGESRIVCEADRFGRPYFVQRDSSTSSSTWDPVPRVNVNWQAIREDRSGLYGGGIFRNDPCPGSPVEWNHWTPENTAVSTSLPFSLERAGSNAAREKKDVPSFELNEVRLLSYPLRVGKQWAWEPYGSITATLEGVEVMMTPVGRVPAWRVRIEGTYQSPGDSLLLWYSRIGLIRREEHRKLRCEFPPCGFAAYFDSVMELTSVDLVGGRF